MITASNSFSPPSVHGSLTQSAGEGLTCHAKLAADVADHGFQAGEVCVRQRGRERVPVTFHRQLQPDPGAAGGSAEGQRRGGPPELSLALEQHGCHRRWQRAQVAHHRVNRVKGVPQVVGVVQQCTARRQARPVSVATYHASNANHAAVQELACPAMPLHPDLRPVTPWDNSAHMQECRSGWSSRVNTLHGSPEYHLQQ